MNRPLTNTRGRFGGLLALFLLVALLGASSALAGFETVKTFKDPAGETIRNRKGLAANWNGTGGVPVGTLYEVGAGGVGGINRYDARGEFQSGFGGSSYSAAGVAVWQSTGCVFVLADSNGTSSGEVRVYSADLSTQIAGFGGASGSFSVYETIAESPGQIHTAGGSASIAVDSTGKVYVADSANLGQERRIMVFEPQTAGSCGNYAYAGQSSDLNTTTSLEFPVVDSAGNLYLVASGGTKIEELPGGQPGAPSCEFSFPAGGIVALTVDPLSGKLFYFTSKDKEIKIHVLSPCNGEGKFEELKAEAIALAPKPEQEENIEALAFNPALTWEAERPAGVLYAAPRNLFEENEPNYIFALPASHKPVVESEAVTHVTSSSVQLGAQVNPKGGTTSYVFQYLTEAAYEANPPEERFAGAIEAPPGGAVLGGGQSPLPASAGITGLQPETEYRYRVIATSADGSATGEAQAFRTFPIELLGLSDHRAYELVSPAQKHGGEVFPINPFVYSCALECKPGTGFKVGHFPTQTSPDGDAVAYVGFPFSPEEGAPSIDEYVSRRTSTGWQTINPTPPLSSTIGLAGYQAFDSNLATGLLYQNLEPSLSPEAPVGYADLYLQPGADPISLSPLLRQAPPNRPEGFSEEASFHLTYAAATPDLSHVLVAANDALTPDTAFAPEAVDGGPSKDNLYEWVGGQPRLVNVLPGNAETVPGAVFGSGSLLSEEFAGSDLNFFGPDYSRAISDDGSRIFWSSESGQVYVRIDGEETREVKDHTGKFLTASADGSRVLLGDGCLYVVATEACEDLTQGDAGFEGIAGTAEDLSRIYFVDSAALTPESEKNANGEHAKAGEHNLYSWQEGDLAFIAALTSGDKRDWTPAPIKRTAEASPDGRFFAFLSTSRLTGTDNTGPCRFESPKFVTGPCPEAFLFDSESGQLSCPSCDPSSELPLGPTRLPLIGGSVELSSLPQPRYLTDEGRLYFDTQDSLVPADTNDGVEDVYQYEPQGTGEQGTCKRPEGCVSLISAGTEPVDSNFLAIDKTGKNVFFTTRDKLLLKDTDDALDLYDAREGGGIPAEIETAPSECQGEACQSQISPPNAPTPGSSSFQGAGNATGPKTCPKGKVRRHGKCIKKHKSKKHHKRAQHRAAGHSRGGAK